MSLIASAISSTTATGNLATATNVLNNGKIQSGLLMGTMTDSSHVVSVSLDGGSFADATVSGTNWSYIMPTGASTWKLFSTHAVTIRTTDANGNILGDVALAVRKGHNRDVNRDGYPDTVMAAFPFSAFAGRAYVYHGSATGINGGGAAGANFIKSGIGSERFGTEVSLGDVNGDGYADLIVGAQAHNTNQGRVHIFHGGSSGLNTTADRIILGEAGTGGFGATVTTGDINGDGYADLIVGAAGAGGSAQGRIYIFHGAAVGIAATMAGAADTTITGEAAANNFGGWIAAGDFNGDGFADALAGADSCCASGSGGVYLFLGSGSGIGTTLASAASTRISGVAGSNLVGAGLAVGDFNGDGFSDLATGSQAHSANLGRVYVFLGSGASIAATSVASANTIMDGEANSQFGRRLTAGDINGDGFEDLAIGGSTHATSTGRIYVYQGSAAGIPVTPNSTISGETTGTLFGHGLTLTDINGDGLADLISGAPQINTSSGRTYLFHGTTTGISATAAAAANAILSGENNSDEFGIAVY